MKKLTVPAAQDIVRIVGPTDQETEQNLLSYYTDPSGGFFSYRTAHTLCRFAFGHVVPLEQILAGCDGVRNLQGRRCNSDVLQLLWRLSTTRSVVTYTLPVRKLVLRRDLSIKVAPPFYFIEDGVPSVFWLQPRKGHALSFTQMGLLASILKATYLVDDFEGVGFEICDLSAPFGKERDPRIYTLKDFTLFSEFDVNEALQRFARAYDELKARGIEQQRRQPKRPDTGPGLFEDDSK